MDLSSLAIPDKVLVHLEFPGLGLLYADDEKKQPMVIGLRSPASEEVIAYEHRVKKKAIARLGKRGNKAINMSPEEIDQANIERLVALTASVDNVVYNGEIATLDTIIDIYSDPKMGWINDQVEERAGSWDSFLSQL